MCLRNEKRQALPGLPFYPTKERLLARVGATSGFLMAYLTWTLHHLIMKMGGRSFRLPEFHPKERQLAIQAPAIEAPLLDKGRAPLGGFPANRANLL
jgi:hypothetical protein